MTCQRYLYKLVWKKIGFPLILVCAVFALSTTFYRHSSYGMVNSPYAVQKGASNTLRSKNTPSKSKFIGVENISNLLPKVFYVDTADEKQKPTLSNNSQTRQAKPYYKEFYTKSFNLGHGKEKDEIDLDDKFFDELRKPHMHVQGGIVEVHEEKIHVHENLYGSKTTTLKTDTDNVLQKQEKNSNTIEIKSKSDSFVGVNSEQRKATPAKHQNDTVQRRGVLKIVDANQNQNNHINADSKSKDEGNAKPDASKQMSKLGENHLNSVDDNNFKSKDELQMQGAVAKPNESPVKVFKSTTEPSEDALDEDIEEPKDGIGNADYEDSFLPSDLSPLSKVEPQRHSTLYYDPSKPPSLFQEWSTISSEQCEGKFVGYFHEFAHLKNVILDKSKFQGRAGGEEIKDVLNQNEQDEYYVYDMGCFQLKCDRRIEYYLNNGHHLPEYVFNVKTSGVDTKDFKQKVVDFTIVVTRYEYANLYHTMTDWYNAFLLMNFFNKTQQDTSVLIIDAHPKGALDHTWKILFKSVDRISTLQAKTKYANMVWSILGYNSVLLQHYLDDIPLVEEFREFFLNSFNLKPDKSLNCDKLNILFIWRRNYLAHPRNPQGIISRKIRNEKQLLKAVKRNYKDYHISGVQIDLFNMLQQLKLISDADVLIGMHGAGLTHAMFLPKHAGVIELVPSYWAAMDHFLAIAKWRGLFYERWVNLDPHIEIPDQTTRIPPAVVMTLLKSVLRKMQCIEPLQ